MHHCPTCRCDEPEPEPINHCNVNGYGCLGDEVPLRRLRTCYPCGLPICTGPECSVLVPYKTVSGVRTVRACVDCLIERAPWGVFPGYEPNMT